VRRGACAAAGGLPGRVAEEEAVVAAEEEAAAAGCEPRVVTGGGDGKKRKKGWGPRLEGEWRASKNGGWEGGILEGHAKWRCV
jgi:hypothetical protein